MAGVPTPPAGRSRSRRGGARGTSARPVGGAHRGRPRRDEAFLVAVKRMGSLDALSREFARAHSERLWKQLVVAPDADAPANTSRTEILVVLSLAVAAALAVKLPALFGLPLSPDEEVPPFYFRNASLFVLPLLTIYFMWKRGSALQRPLARAALRGRGCVRQRLPLPQSRTARQLRAATLRC